MPAVLVAGPILLRRARRFFSSGGQKTIASTDCAYTHGGTAILLHYWRSKVKLQTIYWQIEPAPEKAEK